MSKVVYICGPNANKQVRIQNMLMQKGYKGDCRWARFALFKDMPESPKCYVAYYCEDNVIRNVYSTLKMENYKNFFPLDCTIINADNTLMETE